MIYINNEYHTAVSENRDNLHMVTELSSRAEQDEKEKGCGWLRTGVNETH